MAKAWIDLKRISAGAGGLHRAVFAYSLAPSGNSPGEQTLDFSGSLSPSEIEDELVDFVIGDANSSYSVVLEPRDVFYHLIRHG